MRAVPLSKQLAANVFVTVAPEHVSWPVAVATDVTEQELLRGTV
jgi:hypothetical protein